MSTKENFLNKIPIAYALRSRIDKWALIKLKSFCKAKESVIMTKRQPTDWEKNLDQSCIWWTVISKVYTKHKKLEYREPNTPVNKWGSELKKTFSAEEYRIAEKHLKKCSTSLVIWRRSIWGPSVLFGGKVEKSVPSTFLALLAKSDIFGIFLGFWGGCTPPLISQVRTCETRTPPKPSFGGSWGGCNPQGAQTSFTCETFLQKKSRADCRQR